MQWLLSCDYNFIECDTADRSFYFMQLLLSCGYNAQTTLYYFILWLLFIPTIALNIKFSLFTCAFTFNFPIDC